MANSSGHTFNGFSLLELIVVLAGLGVLSSLAIPNVVKILDFNNIDEAKSLLNTAAADCLQKSRLNDVDSRDLIDEEILSDKRLNTIGYKIDSGAKNCSYLQISPTNEDDNLRFPIGFSVSEGKLSKFANPTSTDQASISSCENWAGVNCKQDESLKELIEWKNSIAAAKTTCEVSYSNWLSGGTTPFEYDRWNPNAESGCPSRPPKNGTTSYKTSNTCTPNGCNRTVFGLDGEFVGFTKEDYDRALEAKYGKICSEWVAEREAEKYTNDPLDQAVTKLECGAREFWFYEGEDQRDQSALKAKACSEWVVAKEAEKYTNDPLDQPQTEIVCGDKEFWFFKGEDQGSQTGLSTAIDKEKEDACKAKWEEQRSKGINAPIGPFEGPGDCGKIAYTCNGSIVEENTYYSTSNCGGAPDKCKLNLREEDQECTDYELSGFWYKKCGPRPKDPPPLNCKYVGMGRPGRWEKTPQCLAWGKCIGIYE